MAKVGFWNKVHLGRFTVNGLVSKADGHAGKGARFGIVIATVSRWGFKLK